MSVAFIQSQIDYYRRHLLSGSTHDRMIIGGLLNFYEAELRSVT